MKICLRHKIEFLNKKLTYGFVTFYICIVCAIAFLDFVQALDITKLNISWKLQHNSVQKMALPRLFWIGKYGVLGEGGMNRRS